MRFFYSAKKLYRRKKSWKAGAISGSQIPVPIPGDDRKIQIVNGGNPQASINTVSAQGIGRGKWKTAFSEAIRAEEEGGRELRAFLDSQDDTDPSLDLEQPKEGTEEFEVVTEYGGFRNPSCLAAFVRKHL